MADQPKELPQRCLDLARIAAYIDGRLDSREREAAAEHFAHCVKCRLLFTENARVRASELGSTTTPGWLRLRRRLLVLAAAMLTVIVCLVAAALLRMHDHRERVTRQDVAELAAAFGPVRPIEPRLSGFAYRPLLSLMRSGERQSGPTSPDVRIAAARIEKNAQDNQSPQMLTALGVAYLVQERLDEAITLLERAARETPTDARLLNDLAAAYLVRGTSRERPEELPKALAAAERAIKAFPSLAEAWFNRALAVDALGLRGQERRAWEDYLKVDGQSGWVEEAKRHITGLSNQSGPSWEQLKPQVLLAGGRDDAVFLLETCKAFPVGCRDYLANELLVSWAESYEARLEFVARGALHAARTIALAHARATGDPMMEDAVAAIETAVAGSNAQAHLDALARGHRIFGEAARLFAQDRVSESQPLFARARDQFARGRSPLWALADLYRTGVWYHQGKLDAAVPLLTRLTAFSESKRYWWLAGRSHWYRGLIRAMRAELADALTDYRIGLSAFERTGQLEDIAALHNLIAADLWELGEPRESWHHQQRALTMLSSIGSLRGRHAILVDAAHMCLSQGLPEAALLFQNTVLEDALASRQPWAIAIAYLQRARSLHQVRELTLAFDDLRDARRWLNSIQDPAFMQQVEAETLLSEGEVWQAMRSKEAIDSLTEAIDAFRKTGARFRLPTLLLLRGRAHESLRDFDSAEADFLRGIDAFEVENRKIGEERLRISHFDEVWDLFAEMIRLQSGYKQRPDLALAFAERARARALHEAFSRGQLNSVTTVTNNPLVWRSHLPSHTALVYYLVLEDRLLAWVLTATSADSFERTVTASELGDLVEMYRNDLARGALPQTLARESARLYDELIRPVARALRPDATLVFVPDAMLHAVPFASLLNRQNGKYLVQEHAVGIAPSAALFLEASNRINRLPSRPPRTALVVGNPRSDPSAYPPMQDLPDAAAEARDIAGLYPEAELLMQETATKGRFLDALRRHEVVHFAGHAMQNPEFPWLSRLLLTPEATSGQSGSLFVHELSTRHLPRVRLIVLAACQTATGQTYRGEGVLNLARPFIAAGVPSVLATLWNIGDRPSRELFGAFHRNLRAGHDSVEALQRAQLALLTSRESSLQSPASWASVIAIGGVSAERAK